MHKKIIKQKHIPLRTCIAYGTKHPKKELIRFVYSKEGGVEVDIKGKKKGRGANITPTSEAFDIAVNKNAIKRALNLKKKLSGNELKVLKSDFLKAIEEKKFRPTNKPVRIKVSKEEMDRII